MECKRPKHYFLGQLGVPPKIVGSNIAQNVMARLLWSIDTNDYCNDIVLDASIMQ